MNIFDKFLKLLAAFEGHKVEYVLIGGYAIILHGFLRATQDIDLFIDPSEMNVARVRVALEEIYEDPSIREITAGELLKYPVIRYGTEDGFSIDLIARIDEAFRFSDLQYENKMIGDASVRVATPETLYKLKKDTRREIDQLDLRFLERKIRNNDR